MDYGIIKGKKKLSKRTQRGFSDGSVWSRWLSNFKDENLAVFALLRLLNYKIKMSSTSKLVRQFYLVKERVLYIMEVKYGYLSYYYPETLANRSCPICESRGCNYCNEGKLYSRILYNKVYQLYSKTFSFHSFLVPTNNKKITTKPKTPLIIPIESDTIAVPTFFDGLELVKFWLKKATKNERHLDQNYMEHTKRTLQNNKFDLMMIPKDGYESGRNELNHYKDL